MRKKGNTVLAGLIICLLFVFLAAAGKLFSVYLKYQKGEASYEKLQEYVQEPEEEESPEPEKEKEEPQSRYLEIDFAECGKETQVPFEPKGDRPVYCRDCFNARRNK